MYRIIVAMVFAFAMLIGGIGSSPPRSLALQSSATPEPTGPPEICPNPEDPHKWLTEIEVQPPGSKDALVIPLDSPDQNLYVVVWTIPPGTCIPYTAAGHQKDGAIVLFVQEGVVEFRAEPFDAGSAAEVTWGHTGEAPAVLPFTTTRTLNPGDWVAQNDQVWFTMRSVGSEPAVVLKAVWAKPIELGPGEGCSGGCK
jgi:hypothetical protein